LGALTAIAAVLARVEAVERIAESVWATECAPLFMPALLWKAIWRRVSLRRKESID